MKLVMFDIDGTLTDTSAADANGFVEAVRDELGITGIDTDWAAYPQATSEGILDEVVRRATGRPVTPAESQAVQHRLVAEIAPDGHPGDSGRRSFHSEADGGRFCRGARQRRLGKHRPLQA